MEASSRKLQLSMQDLSTTRVLEVFAKESIRRISFCGPANVLDDIRIDRFHLSI